MDRPDRPPLAVYAIGAGAYGVGGVAAPIHGTVWAGVALHGDAPRAVPPVHEAHMGYAPEVGVVKAEDIAGPRNRLVTRRRQLAARAPDGAVGREQRRAPRIPWLGITGPPVAPAHKRGAPRMARAEAAV